MIGILSSGKARLVAVLATCSLAFAAVATTAAAQDQDGLVNVAITDTQIAVPVSIAANVCDVNVGILAQQERFGGAQCEADATSIATHNQGPGGGGGGAEPGGVEQDGLVNVAIVDTQVAVPVAVAANICDANVGVLATQLRIGETTCEADADSVATHGPGPGGGATTFPF
jgi:hypothetical protein